MAQRKVGLIFLHGSGDSGTELKNFLNMVTLHEYNYKSFNDVILRQFGWSMKTPTAPMRPYSAAMGENMNVWYNRSASFCDNGLNEAYEDISGADETVATVSILIKL